MLDKMKQLMEMKRQADQIKKELDAIVVETEEVRGIRIDITGSQVVRTLRIDPEMIRPENKERLEKDLLRSINAAVKKAQTTAAQKMAQVMPLGF